LISLVFLAGCAAEPKRVVVPRNVLVVCPPEPPEVHCPAWPVADVVTVRDLLTVYARGSLAHFECRAAVEAWEASWVACHGEGM